MTDVTIYHMPEREIHMVGEYVGVAWNVRRVKKDMKGDDGLIYYAYAPVRSSAPYIDFVAIREGNDGPYEDHDSPVEGGLREKEAVQVSQELMRAVEYLRSLP